MISGNDGSKSTEFTHQSKPRQETDDSSRKYKKQVPGKDAHSKADETNLRDRIFSKGTNPDGVRPKTKKSDFSQAFHPSRMGGEVMQIEFTKTIADQQKEIEDLKSQIENLELELRGRISGQDDQPRPVQHDKQATGQNFGLLEEENTVLKTQMAALERQNKKLRKELNKPGKDSTSSSAHPSETPSPQDYDFLQEKSSMLETRLTETEQQNRKLQQEVQELREALSTADERQETDFMHIQTLKQQLNTKDDQKIASTEGSLHINGKLCTEIDLSKMLGAIYEDEWTDAESFLETLGLSEDKSQEILYAQFNRMYRYASQYATKFSDHINSGHDLMQPLFAGQYMPNGGVTPGHREQGRMITASKPALELLIKTAGPAGALLYRREAIADVSEEYQKYLKQEGTDKPLTKYLGKCFDVVYYMHLMTPHPELSFPRKNDPFKRKELDRIGGDTNNRTVKQPVWPGFKNSKGEVLSKGIVTT